MRWRPAAREGRVIAVGTTSVRSLETAARGELKPFSGDTDIFIYPGKTFHVVDALVTNFHLPESTLLMLVSAFAGYPETMAAYAGLWLSATASSAMATPCSLPATPPRAVPKPDEPYLPHVFRATRHRWQGTSGASDLSSRNRGNAGLHAGRHAVPSRACCRGTSKRSVRIILGNTFHLWLRPGTEVIKRHGDLRLHASGGADPYRFRWFSGVQSGAMRKIKEEGVCTSRRRSMAPRCSWGRKSPCRSSVTWARIS